MRRLALVLAILVCAPASAQSPQLLAGSLEDRLAAETRGLDQVTNPDYTRRAAPLVADYFAAGGRDVFVDPFRASWRRGTQLQTSFASRYRAKLNVRMWGPPAAQPGPHPAVLLAPGSGNDEAGYRGMAQGLAEAGYVVMAYEPQGQGVSDAQPAAEFCDPAGSWREPQELGVRERGPCAGQYPDDPAPGEGLGVALTRGTPVEPVGFLADAALFAAQLYVDGDYPEIEYSGIRPRHVLGAFDAVAWLLSDANPWRARVDGGRVALVGHSAGADAALQVANGDPHQRFKAAVMWDSGAGLLPTVQPRVPTMIQVGEDQNIFGPRHSSPDPARQPVFGVAERFRAVGVPSSLIPLRGSTHQEWLYLPYQMINPYLAVFFNASRYGERVGLYFTLAWLDRWLMPGRAADAQRRLTAARFDASADASSIGSGTTDLLGRNKPYKIAGRPIDAALSRGYPSYRISP